MVLSTNLGFPRIGAQRDLKKAVEAYWKGQLSQQDLLAEAKRLRALHWKVQADQGLEHIPSNDFSFYDHVLDMTCMLGAVPARYKHVRGPDRDGIDLDTYFAMARGCQKEKDGVRVDVIAMEMTKLFDTNYHYLVPEFEAHTEFKLSSTKIFDEFAEALALGYKTRPVLVGPVTYIRLGKGKYEGYSESKVLEAILPIYAQILNRLKEQGADWVQVDEPFLAMDLTAEQQTLFTKAYDYLAAQAPGVKLLLATYFESLRDNAPLAFGLPVAGVHVDLCRGPGKANTVANAPDVILDQALDLLANSKAGSDSHSASDSGAAKILSLGVVDGRNIWKNDLAASIALVQKAVAALGHERVFVAGSSSLLHSPVDLALETKLPEEVKAWLAFATQKVGEIVTIARALNRAESKSESDEAQAAVAVSDAVVADRQSSAQIHSVAVQQRLASVHEAMMKRQSPFAERQKAQEKAFAEHKMSLPLFPTTTIGSFPQTAEIRKARADYKAKRLDEAGYIEAMQKEIRAVVDYQHEVDLDVLVHGEPERNDMVEYFGEQLAGFTFTSNGWVQSYGSRCVKPPIIFGDVSRPKPMTVFWSKYAQSLTAKPMKGMLTGPITILQWSFVRDDQPRSETARQLALAIRDEVADLEKAGIRIIQIDEAAIREGLPLRAADRAAYLQWAVEAFRLSASVVRDTTQIHTHMCYSEFNDIMPSVAAMDTDSISIETSRSQMELLEAFENFHYPNEIGPGVYDIHSPRIPTEAEIESLLAKAVRVLKPRQIWVNPDCGLKTRGWAEVKPALLHMVTAAKKLRAKYAAL